MSRDDIHKLLGGYATGTLSEAERSALFGAALEDQALFDALAKEEALRDVLRDPSARRQLIAALRPAREPFAVRAWRWLRRPAALAMAGGLAALLIIGGIAVRQARQHPRREVYEADVIAPPPAAQFQVGPAAPPPKNPLPKKKIQPRAVLREARRVPPPPAQREPLAQAAPVSSMNEAKVAPSGAAKASLPYSLLLQDTDGAYAPVAPGTVFHPRDSVRLRIDPSASGYISLFQRFDASPQSAAGWMLVAAQPAEKGQPCLLPSTGGLTSDVPAKIELMLVFSHLGQPGFAGAPQGGLRITLEYR